MFLRKASASTSMVTRSPERATARRRSVRTVVLRSQSAARKAAKSCRPTSVLRGLVHARGVERARAGARRSGRAAGARVGAFQMR